MNEPEPNRQDPATVAMTLDILSNVLVRADNPGAVGAYLCEELRELTGAKCVLFIQCLGEEATLTHRVISLNPARCGAWAESPEAMALYESIHREERPRIIWRPDDPSETAVLLRRAGFELSLTVPLNVGAFRVGAMLALGLPDSHLLESEFELLITLSTVVALVLRNAFLYERQEQTIQERTRELRGANLALRESTQRLQLATASGQLGVWDWDIANNTLTWDDRMFELYGVAHGTFANCFEAWRQRLHPEDLEPALEASRAALAGTRDYDTEFRIVRPDGEVRVIKANALTIRDREGRAIRQIGLNRDTTEHKRAEEAILEASRFNRQIISSVKEGIIVYDRELKYQLWNTFMEQLSGIPAGEVLGRHVLDAFPFQRGTGLLQHIARALAGEASAPFEFQFHLPASGRSGWCSDTVSPLRNAAGEIIGAINIVRDITDWKKAEEERLRLEEDIRHNQKMEAIGQLAGGIAHDFNNMLTGILGYANMLKLDAAPGSANHAAADTIEKAAERAAELTGKLLGFARRGKFLATRVDVNEIVREVVSLLSRTIEKNISITQRLMAQDILVLGDPGQVQQVVLNLAINARDAMPGGGEMTLETGVKTLDGDFCRRHGELKAGRYVILTVQDTGCGIRDEDRQRIFEPFFTTKEEGKGTGMGLAMVYGIAKNHGGHVEVASVVGQGSRFAVYLPHLATGADGDASMQTPDLHRGSGKILLVDDEDVIRKVAGKMLRTLGYEVLEAGGGREALALCQAQGAEITLAILDMVMPEMDGGATFRALRRIKPDLRAILSSGFGIDGRAQEIIDLGMQGFIQKPYKMSELSEVVKKAVLPA